MEKKSKSFIKLCAKYGVDPNVVPEITSFEQACKKLELSPTNLPKVGNLPARHRKRIIADFKLTIIAEALRNGWVPNYNDTSTVKYSAWFRVEADQKRPSGFGLSYAGCVFWLTSSYVGLRLLFPTSDVAEFFGKHFIKLHVDHHLLT
ncbi:hypothetical protein [Paraflavitalea pollutisoli]|uniref:hypothetical protein n=1 Tax=Paraflavitalea pollutisoli TaxID=3034143 RepID=UPI0023EC308C|nr:hypothetical protein [Paraflavitalea sp. H1-2-19X]